MGIAAYFRLPTEPPVLWCIIVTALALFAHVAARAAHAPLAVVTGATLVVALGFVSAKLRTEFVAAPVLPVAISKAVVVGRIVGVEGRGRGGRRLWLHVTTIAGLPAALTPARIVVYQHTATEDLSIGHNIRLTADLRPLSRPARPDGFDFACQNYFESIGAVAFTARPIEADKSDTSSASLNSMDRLILGLSEFRRRIGERLERALPVEVGGIAKALMTGERGGLSRQPTMPIATPAPSTSCPYRDCTWRSLPTGRHWRCATSRWPRSSYSSSRRKASSMRASSSPLQPSPLS